MSVVPLDALWVTANFKESQLEDLRIGQPVELTADAYGGDVTYHGKIVGVDAGTGSAFALLPPQNATGNWIKVTQRVPVRITLDPREIAPHPLRIGLSMRVIVDTHDRSGSVLRRGTSTPSAYETRVFDAELKNANDVVDTIIRKNEGGSPRSSNAPAMRQEMRDAS
ncbi:secretion protein HlyD family protein [Burkholderia sp. lig30]|nr:secretion protein HlyD family protein [Burkholderia sp. lig30]